MPIELGAEIQINEPARGSRQEASPAFGIAYLQDK
jgi:hypothetical protein